MGGDVCVCNFERYNRREGDCICLYLYLYLCAFFCVCIFESCKRLEGMEGRLLPGNLWLGVNYVESHLWLTASRTAVHSTYFSISIFVHLDFFLISFCIFGSLKDPMTIDNSYLICLYSCLYDVLFPSIFVPIQYRSGKIRSILICNILT